MMNQLEKMRIRLHIIGNKMRKVDKLTD